MILSIRSRYPKRPGVKLNGEARGYPKKAGKVVWVHRNEIIHFLSRSSGNVEPYARQLKDGSWFSGTPPQDLTGQPFAFGIDLIVWDSCQHIGKTVFIDKTSRCDTTT